MKTNSGRDVEKLVSEYREHLALLNIPQSGDARIEWGQIVGLLCESAEWSYSGAEHVVGLARKYGVFVLRNSLALAVALGLEDGELGL